MAENRIISESMIEQAANAIRETIIKNGPDMIVTFERLPGNLPVSLKLVWKPSEVEHHVNADIKITFKKDEVADSESYTFYDDEYGPLFQPPEG